MAPIALFGATLAACSSSATERASSSAGALQGGQLDSSDPVADVVVSIGRCTGTFLTPTAVLTARHCVCGGDGSIDIEVGAALGNKGKYTSTTTRNYPAIYGTCPFDLSEDGEDLAILFLDVGLEDPSAPPAFDYPYIHRPSFAAPCASDSSSCPDANGGQYVPSLGMAGYAGGPREVAYDSLFNHYPGHTVPFGQYWVRSIDSIYTEHGDSGGPLFQISRDERGNPYRDVLGVLSEANDSSDFYADITRGATKDWIIRTMTDTLAAHTARWRAWHPNIQWLGEVDYLGPCQTLSDADCDHFYDAQDNCPNFYNPDQLATQGTEIGDACIVPQACTVYADCTSNTSVAYSCSSSPSTNTVLQYRMKGTTTWAEGDWLLPDSYEYRVCALFPAGTRGCTLPMAITPNLACPGPSCTFTTEPCASYQDGPPDYTLSCIGEADFYDQSPAGTMTFLSRGSSYSGTESDYDTHVLACAPDSGTSHCVRYSTYAGVASWCQSSGGGPGGVHTCHGPDCCVGTCF